MIKKDTKSEIVIRCYSSSIQSQRIRWNGFIRWRHLGKMRLYAMPAHPLYLFITANTPARLFIATIFIQSPQTLLR